MSQLQGKNVLLTGASRGIGQVIARTFAQDGAHVALVARDERALQALANELNQTGIRAVALAADLNDFTSHKPLIERATQALGSLDILVNNAALEGSAHYAEFPAESIEEMLRVDLLAPMLLTRAVLPQLLAQQSGHIVNIGSVAGKSGAPFNTTYAASKGGLGVFSQSLRAELKGRGVSVSCVTPGFISEVGMYATQAAVTGRRAPRAAGESTPQQVADAVLRAIRANRAEIIVSPGPMRLLQAINQIAPDFFSNLTDWLGIQEVFRTIADAQRPVLAPERTSHAQDEKANARA